MKRLRAWMWENREAALAIWAAILLLATGFGAGRITAPAGPIRTVTVTETKERIAWREKTEAAATSTATAEKKEHVRVVTRWLRPDGTTLKLQLRETGSSTSAASTAEVTSARSQSTETDRASASTTVVDLSKWIGYQPPPRVLAGPLMGLDLRAGAARRVGAMLSVRIVGPVHVTAVAFPGAGMYGAGVAVSF